MDLLVKVTCQERLVLGGKLILLWTWIMLSGTCCCWERRKGKETTLNFLYLFFFSKLILALKSPYGNHFFRKESAQCLVSVQWRKVVVCCSNNSYFSKIPLIFTANRKKNNLQRRKNAISWKKTWGVVIMQSVTRFKKQHITSRFCDLPCELFFVCCQVYWVIQCATAPPLSKGFYMPKYLISPFFFTFIANVMLATISIVSNICTDMWRLNC